MTSFDWLRSQRWFRSKRRPIASVDEVDRATLVDEVDRATLGDAAALVVLGVTYADGGPADRYLHTDPDDGRGVWAAIARATAAGADLAGRSGRFECRSTGAISIDDPLEERPMGVEQSNTSVRLGDGLILKLYRLLEPGANPDLEISAFLTDAGFAGAPPVAGSVNYHTGDADPASAAMLQAFVPSTGDAWAAMLDALARDPGEGVAMAGEIGDVTRRLHDALASRPEDPAFPARPASPAEAAAWRASAERQLAQAVTAVSGEAHARLVDLAPRLTARFADTFGAASGTARVSRIHGDYHLGQLLARADGGYSVIDFEGEPARPLAERRQPASPLRDVAGMLRSLDYAARTAERESGLDPGPWLDQARSAFLGAYGAIGPAEAALVDAFELEKACYEVRYEANNRPDWLWLPLAALERLGSG